MAPPVNGAPISYSEAQVGDIVSRRFTGSAHSRVQVIANNEAWAYWNGTEAIASQLMILSFSDGTFLYYRLQVDMELDYEYGLLWWDDWS